MAKESEESDHECQRELKQRWYRRHPHRAEDQGSAVIPEHRLFQKVTQQQGWMRVAQALACAEMQERGLVIEGSDDLSQLPAPALRVAVLHPQ